MKQNMQRLRRGELTRMNSRAAVHNDVFMGPAPEQKSASSNEELGSLQSKLATLKQENADLGNALKKAEATLAKANEDAYIELKENLEEAQAKAAEAVADREKLKQELKKQAQPAKGLRVLKITSVSTSDEGLMRIDCEVKPTDGPMGSTVAVIIPTDEVNKLLDDEEADEEDVDDDEG